LDRPHGFDVLLSHPNLDKLLEMFKDIRSVRPEIIPGGTGLWVHVEGFKHTETLSVRGETKDKKNKKIKKKFFFKKHKVTYSGACRVDVFGCLDSLVAVFMETRKKNLKKILQSTQK